MALASARLLRGKTACITGGTTGIGRAITLEYLPQGANVAVNHLGLDTDETHRKSLLEEAQKLKQQGSSAVPTGDIIELAGDVTDPETGQKLVSEAVRQWGALDVFVAISGIFRAAEFLMWVVLLQKRKMAHETLSYQYHRLSKQQFDRTMEVNVNGTFYSCQAGAQQMVKQIFHVLRGTFPTSNTSGVESTAPKTLS